MQVYLLEDRRRVLVARQQYTDEEFICHKGLRFKVYDYGLGLVVGLLSFSARGFPFRGMGRLAFVLKSAREVMLRRPKSS